MSEQGQEQNRSEEPTPYKLQKAREKGQVARGMDLGFVGSLVAVAIVAIAGGEAFFGQLAQMMEYSFVAGISGRGDPAEAVGVVAASYWGAFEPLIVLGLALVIILGTLEILQLRGFIFTTHPLKPDFQRLNPAKGLKRLFSMRMLKETLKNIIKLIAYSAAAWLIITAAIATWGIRLVDAGWLVRAIEQSGSRLLFAFIALAIVFMVIDQIIVRREFHKQMRMGRGELTREINLAETKTRLEDLYLPYKQKRRTKGQIALEAGLGELADGLFNDPTLDPESTAAGFINADKGVADSKAALDGAKYILMERFAEDASLLEQLLARGVGGQRKPPLRRQADQYHRG